MKTKAKISILIAIAIFIGGPIFGQTKSADSPKKKSPTASYTIDVTVELSSEISLGKDRMMVELRQGSPGTSKVFDTKYIDGRTGIVSFTKMPAGSYFIAIGNGETVAVGPVHQFDTGQSRRSKVRVTQTSGNVGSRSRGGL